MRLLSMSVLALLLASPSLAADAAPVALGEAAPTAVPQAAAPCFAPFGGPGPAISEIRIDMPGTDTDEYCEICAAAGTVLSGVSYIVIGDSQGACGSIEAVVNLDGLAVPADGLLSIGDSDAGPHVFTYDIELPLNFENSDNVTHMLVQDFSGMVGDDIDLDDDGAIDQTFWSSIHDCVGLYEGTTPDCVTDEFLYCAEVVGPDGSFVPGHVYKCDGVWFIGGFDLGVNDTPGESNEPHCAIPVESTTWGTLKNTYR